MRRNDIESRARHNMQNASNVEIKRSISVLLRKQPQPLLLLKEKNKIIASEARCILSVVREQLDERHKVRLLQLH
jgi:hypothetical protein